MIRYILKRLLQMIPVILCVAILIFTIMYFCPGDPTQAMLSAEATDIEREALREQLGLNDPFIQQLGRYLYQTFIQGDLGSSYITGKSVTEELLTRFPRTLVFAVSVMVVQLLVGIPLGVTAATHQNGWGDRLCMIVALLGVSIPSFWLAMEMVILFSLKLGWLPPYGIGGIEYWILPVFCSCFGSIAMQARQTRSGMLECIRSDYVVTARAKGLSERNILYRYALPNAIIPLIQTMGDGFGSALGGTVIIENVFSIPGVGLYMTTAVTQRDYPIIRGGVVILAIAFCIVMLLVDCMFAFVDPRIKAQYESRNRHVSWGRKAKEEDNG